MAINSSDVRTLFFSVKRALYAQSSFELMMAFESSSENTHYGDHEATHACQQVKEKDSLEILLVQNPFVC